MSAYLDLPDYSHGNLERLGILLVNLGTPDNPRPQAVRKFLAEFLWDPRVIEAPRWLWWLILHAVILPFRPAKTAHAYRQIWTEAGSPLLHHSRGLAVRLQEALGIAAEEPGSIRVELGMTYGSPSIAAALAKLREAGLRRLLVLPLYPQYSATTTGSVFDRVTRELRRWRWLPEVRFINGYHDDPGYLAAIQASIAQHWRQHGRRHLLFSFHGIPKRYRLAGDPYPCQCLRTARLISEQLQLGAGDWSVGFQSQMGRDEWLRPYTEQLLREYAGGKQRDVTVICPGFAADCLETLEEIEIRNRALFLGAGGNTYDYIPALNALPDHAALLADIVRRHIQGWPRQEQETRIDRECRERALRAGAAR